MVAGGPGAGQAGGPHGQGPAGGPLAGAAGGEQGGAGGLVAEGLCFSLSLS